MKKERRRRALALLLCAALTMPAGGALAEAIAPEQGAEPLVEMIVPETPAKTYKAFEMEWEYVQDVLIVRVRGASEAPVNVTLYDDQPELDPIETRVMLTQQVLEAGSGDVEFALLTPGESLVYRCDWGVLEAHMDESGVLSCLILRDAMPETLY